MKECMTDELSIIEEKELYFNEREQLWVMLIRRGNRYGIEINTRSSKLGRIFVKNRRVAENCVCHIYSKLLNIKYFVEALHLIQLGFRYKNIAEIMLVINTYNKKYDFNHLFDLRKYYCYKTSPCLDVFILDYKKEKPIRVYFEDKEKPIGYFKSVGEEENRKFVFELSPGII